MTAVGKGRASDPSDRPGERFVVQTTAFGLTTDDRGRISNASRELCELLAVDENALAGRRVSALVHPDDRVETERQQMRPFDGRQLTLRLRRADGTYTWMSATTAGPTFPAAHGRVVRWAFVDVSERVQFERRLVEMASVWSDVFNVLSEGVIVIDRDGIALSANAAAADFLGTDLKDLPGSLARAQVVVVDENGLPMPRDRLPSTRAFATGKVQEEQVAYRRRDGTTRWLHARVVPLTQPAENMPERVVVLLDDAVGPSHDQPHGAVQEAALTALTRRELDVLELLAQGHDVTAAASTLDISLHTARGHLKQLMKKLDARSQLQAVIFAARAGLIRVE